jgi:putative restriction endonuclease
VGFAVLVEEHIKKLESLRTGRVGTHERPHKPALLLAIMSLADAGQLKENRIVYGPELYGLFRRFFDVVRAEDDALNMLDPFWRLRSDGLLQHVPNAGFESAVEVLKGPPSVKRLHEICECSALPDELHGLLSSPGTREDLRRAVIETYFPGKAAELLAVIQEEQCIGAYGRILEDTPDDARNAALHTGEAIRDQAFRRIVLRAYDYRCAACGLRVVLDDAVLVEAAHLVPFSVGQDDDPRNGIALCRNHHWAMDRWLIAPTTDRAWQVSEWLDERIEGQRDLIRLNGLSVIVPRDAKYCPKEESLRWRQAHLRSA